MPITHLLTIYFIQLLLVWLPSFGIAKLFAKAGRTDTWKAYVPFYNTWEMQKMTGRPMHWVFWQLIPIVGWFITPGIFIEFVKLFGRYSIADHTGASLLAPLYMPYIGNNKEVRYIGKDRVNKIPKGKAREWFDAAIFAVVAATLIRLFVFEAYVIPTGSMEKTLLVNDYLFVSKMTYGSRVPNTPLSIPFVHNMLPFGSAKSYVEWISLPYIRWWNTPVKRNDPCVFNFPAGDTVINKPEFQSAVTYYDLVHQYMREANVNEAAAKTEIQNRTDEFPIIIRPIDKQENYVKRCVAVGGDKIQVKQGILYVNDAVSEVQPYSQLWYDVTTNGSKLNNDQLKADLDVDVDRLDENERNRHNGKAEVQVLNEAQGLYKMLLTNKAVAKLKTLAWYKTVTVENFGQDQFMFPAYYNYDTKDSFDVNNYGPLVIPQKGVAVNLTPDNIRQYRRAIQVYEHNEFVPQPDGSVLINGTKTNTYTFKMNYYWMMGDNRHNSQDSRFWGYVPEDHIVGKPKLIWMSWEHGPRWNRLFNIIK